MAKKSLKKTTKELKKMVGKEVGERLTTVDRIFLFYNQDADDNRIVLTDKEERIRIRWSAAFHYLLEFNTKSEAIKFLMKEHDVSEVQAYRDLKNAESLFGDVLSSNKLAMKAMLSEWAIEVLKLAKADKNIDGMNKAISNLIKIHGVDRDEFDAAIFENIVIPEVNIHVNEYGQKVLDGLVAQGAVNLTELREKMEADAAEKIRKNTIQIPAETVTNE